MKGKRVALLIGPQFHAQETLDPKTFLQQRKIKVDLIAPDTSELTDKKGEKKLVPDYAVKQVQAQDYDGVIIPGGGAPERIRLNEEVLDFVRAFWKTGRPLGAICHGPQVLISADIVDGVVLTCYAGIRDDVKLAGAAYVDREVCIDGQLITSRNPNDLPAFNETFFQAVEKSLVSEEEKDVDPLRALELAISREKGAHDFYQHAAGSLKKESIRNKFKYLASIENEHFDQLSELYQKLSGGSSPSIDQAASEIGNKNVDAEMDSETALDLAMAAEQKAYDFYRNAALKAQSEPARKMFEYLAGEELEHKRLLSTDKAADLGGRGHFQWATYWDVPPGMEDMW